MASVASLIQSTVDNRHASITGEMSLTTHQSIAGGVNHFAGAVADIQIGIQRQSKL